MRNKLPFRFIGIAFVTLLVATFFVVSVPVVTHADGVSSGLNDLNSAAGNSFPKSNLATKTIPQLFGLILQYALGIGFILAVLMLIYGGYQYIVSAGNEEMATKGRHTIVYALIGMVIIVFSFAIVRVVLNFAQNGLGGGTSTTQSSGGSGSGTCDPVTDPNCN